MQYDPSGNNLDQIMRDGPALRDLMIRKGVAGAKFWTRKSIKDTGHNSRSIGVFIARNAQGVQTAVLYAFGHYARFREHGTRFNRPERVLHQAVDVIRSTE
ncbi:Uncharacterised protein [Mycobacteroides abscessus subsp. abscessus]|nr:Uncharacterised protein [Mycobacteroides abscessus subsp. abscessus]